MIITIDGPAGSGKSTASRQLAKSLNIAYLDTGATYRAVTWKALHTGVDLADADALAEVACNIDLKLIGLDGGVKVLVDGRDISKDIRSPEVTAQIRYAASSPVVRGVLVELQRRIGKGLGSFVTEGRDQGSIVFPDADLKIYLDASPETRAKRRTAELHEAECDANYAEVLKAIIERDESDRNRQVGPLAMPANAVVVDTSDKTIDETLHAMLSLCRSNDAV